MSNTVMLPPGRAEEFNRGMWRQRLEEAIWRGVVCFFWQSAANPGTHNPEFQQAQRRQVRRLEPLGIRETDVRVVHAVWSERPGVVHERLGQLTEMVTAGQVGLVVLARYCWLGQNPEARSELLRLMKEHGVLIMVEGRIYDPADASDAFVLDMQPLVTKLENRARARWVALSRRGGRR
jgi:hypothetical protein